VRRIAEPLREATRHEDLTDDLADKDLARLARYCVGRARQLCSARSPTPWGWPRAQSVAASSPMLIGLTSLSSDWTDGEWILATDGLAEQTATLTHEFRNPAARTAVLGRDDFERCHTLVQGHEGLPGRLIEATLPRP
jgi:hypothetical protein